MHFHFLQYKIEAKIFGTQPPSSCNGDVILSQSLHCSEHTAETQYGVPSHATNKGQLSIMFHPVFVASNNFQILLG